MARIEPRTAALDASLTEYEKHGFELESRTDTQAILVRRSRIERVMRRNGDRIVVWVDQHGTVEARSVEARRW